MPPHTPPSLDSTTRRCKIERKKVRFVILDIRKRAGKDFNLERSAAMFHGRAMPFSGIYGWRLGGGFLEVFFAWEGLTP